MTVPGAERRRLCYTLTSDTATGVRSHSRLGARTDPPSCRSPLSMVSTPPRPGPGQAEGLETGLGPAAPQPLAKDHQALRARHPRAAAPQDPAALGRRHEAQGKARPEEGRETGLQFGKSLPSRADM